MEPSSQAVTSSGHKRTLAFKVLGLAAGAAVAAGFLSLWIGHATPDSLLNRLNAGLLPAELADALFLYQRDGANALYTLTDGMYETVNIGTTLPTVSVARRGEHLASVQLTAEGAYEVRTDTRLRYSSDTLKTSAAVSPSGTLAAFAEIGQDEVKAAIDARAGKYATNIAVLDGSDALRVLGPGFSPFFLDEARLAWFTDDGLVLHDLGTGSTTVLSEAVRVMPPPYPAPAVARDGHVIAWADPAAGVVRIALVSQTSASIVASYEGIGSPNLAVATDALYVLRHSPTATTITRHQLINDPAGERVLGIPEFGRIMQLVP